MRESFPSCPGDYPNCFARWKDRCQLLRSTNFGDRECPFYKSTDQFIAEERATEERKRKARSSCNCSRAMRKE